MPDLSPKSGSAALEHVRGDPAPELARLLEARLLRPAERVLCYGCGRGADVAWLKARKFRAQGYDPYPPFGYAREPAGTFDVVCLIYLLTRLKTDENRRAVLARAFGYVRPGGRMLIITRNWRRIAARAGRPGRDAALQYLGELLADCSVAETQTHEFEDDGATLCLFARRPGGIEPRNPVIQLTEHAEVAEVCARLAREPRIGLDVETTLDEPRRICLIQCGASDRTYLIDALTLGDWGPVKALLEDAHVEKVIHNAQFEEDLFAKRGIRIRNVFDTLPASRRKHRRGVEGGHKLNEVCERELGIYMDKTLQTSDWTSRPLTVEQIAYAALDAEVLLDLYRVFHPPDPLEPLSLFE
ncbi:MAG TPA: methyltransferase domain-containing protein [Candidatus Hydrogenedentes bacterium]|nr:methyltransferase domain-containing protein [Candidatus Hydrogenedentota bacterium]